MRKEENTGHIVRDKRAITSLSRYHKKYLLSVTVIQHLLRVQTQ